MSNIDMQLGSQIKRLLSEILDYMDNNNNWIIVLM